MITRSNAYDTIVSADGMKDFCRLMPCPTAAERTKDFSRIDFGWLGRFGASKSGYSGPDVWEYVISRAAAWDCPISLRLDLDEVASNPRRDDCFDVLKTWEDARLANRLSQPQREMLVNVRPEHAHYVRAFQQREMWNRRVTNRDLTDAQHAILADHREHHLFVNKRGQHELVEIDEIPNVVGGSVKAYSFRRAQSPDDAYVLIWAAGDDVNLKLPLGGIRLAVMRPLRTGVPFRTEAGLATISVGDRMYLVFARTKYDQVRQVLRRARSVK